MCQGLVDSQASPAHQFFLYMGLGLRIKVYLPKYCWGSTTEWILSFTRGNDTERSSTNGLYHSQTEFHVQYILESIS